MLVLFLLIILTDGLGKVWVCCEMAITAGRKMQLDEKEEIQINKRGTKQRGEVKNERKKF